MPGTAKKTPIQLGNQCQENALWNLRYTRCWVWSEPRLEEQDNCFDKSKQQGKEYEPGRAPPKGEKGRIRRNWRSLHEAVRISCHYLALVVAMFGYCRKCSVNRKITQTSIGGLKCYCAILFPSGCIGSVLTRSEVRLLKRH